MGTTLREFQLDSIKTSEKMLVNFINCVWNCTWTPDGFHQKTWLNVTDSEIRPSNLSPIAKCSIKYIIIHQLRICQISHSLMDPVPNFPL